MPPATPAKPRSARLVYERLAAGRAEAFHRLAMDPHVRRYLLDGQVVKRAWADAAIAASERLFTTRGVGLWLLRARPRDQDPPFGFAGFHVFEEIGPEPQLVYALVRSATRRGYATEAGEALLRFASDPDGPDMGEIPAAVDAPNRASSRVLEKLGFERTGEVPGAFGPTYTYRWQRPRPPVTGSSGSEASAPRAG